MMNLARWLERAGREDGERPALGLGARVLRSYGETAGRVARLAGALAGDGPQARASASRSPRRTARTIVEALYAIWHAGLAAVPANAKLHGAELGYILEQSGARVCLASRRYRRRHRTACAEVARSADRDRRRGIRAAARRRSDRDRAARARRSRLAVLHLGHDRPAEGRDAHPQGAGRREQRLPGRGRHASRPAIRSCTPRR